MSANARSRPPSPNRSSAIWGISLSLGLVLLFGVGSLFWLVQNRGLFGPTPTPTATGAPLATPTPDFRATRVQEDRQTQVAYQQSESGTPTVADNQSFLPQVSAGATLTPTPIAGAGANPSPVPAATSTAMNTTKLPIVISNPSSPLPVATPSPISPVATPTPLPPVATPSPVVDNTAIPLPTATPLPSPTATLIPSPTPTIYSVSSLNGVIRNAETILRLGPSNLYPEAGKLPANTGIKLLARDATGEWVYVCCINSEPHWVRQAYAQARDNPTPTPTPTQSSAVATAVPTEINPNDVRWLPFQPLSSSLEPLPPPTAVPADDYPLYRHDAGNRGLAPRLPGSPLVSAWPSPGLASNAFIGPVIVGGLNVLAMSADSQLYSFDRTDGHQRWRYALGQPARFAPTIQDANIYVVSNDGQIFGLVDAGDTAAVVWQKKLAKLPSSGFVVAGYNANKLYISTTDGTQNQLFAVNRSTGEILSLDFRQTGNAFQAPAVGGQLIYVGGSQVWALDVENFEQVWTNADAKNSTVAPLYAPNGIVALAELYVADNAGHVFSIDANTGVTLWQHDGNEAITGLAVNNTMLFIAGNGYVKAVTRTKEHKELWRAGLTGQPIGGPIADQERLLVVTDNGDIQSIALADGAVRHEAALIQGTLGGAVAVSGPYLFAPGANGSLYALRGTAP